MYLARQSIKVIKAMLRERNLSQSALSDKTGVSIGQVNKTITKLKRGFLANTNPGRGVRLVDEERLFLTIGAESPLRAGFRKRYFVKGGLDTNMGKVGRALGNFKYAFTLLPAIRYYSAAASGVTISLHISKGDIPGALARLDQLDSGGGVPVEVYDANDGILFDRVKRRGLYFVSFEQLIIDLFRTPQLVYLGMQLLNEYKAGRKHG
jgi:biotin operon repressor